MIFCSHLPPQVTRISLPQGGGGIVNQLRRSYSSGELADGDMNRNVKALPHIPDDDYDDHTHSSGTTASPPLTRQRRRQQQLLK